MVKYPAKMENICSSLIQRSYSNDCPACISGSLKNDNARDFAYILKRSPAFVDKTHVIKKLFERKYIGLIATAPPHFGKSVNLSMLKYFFEIEVSAETGEPITKADIRNEPVTDTYNYKLFQNLAVCRQHTKFAKRYLGRHPVILLDFSLKTSINSYEEALSHCKAVVRTAFKQHSYLANSTKLRDDDKDYFKMWCDDIEFQKFDSPGNDIVCHLYDAIDVLKQMLCSHFGRKCVFLADEYDAVFRGALVNTDEKTFVECRCLYECIIDGPLIRGSSKNILLGVLTGISHMATYCTRDFDRLYIYPFLRSMNRGRYGLDPLFHLHGFTQQEFDFLMDKHNISDELRQQAIHYYNGFCSIYGQNKLYNPSSVVRFLDTKIIKGYWSNSEFFEKFQHFLNFTEIDLLIKTLIFGQAVRCTLIDTPSSFGDAVRDLYERNSECAHLYYFTSFLYEQGYLKILEHHDESLSSDDDVTVTLANEEIRITLIDELKKYYKTSGKFDWDSMSSCAQYFDNIDSVDCKISNEDVRNIYSSMEKYCSAFFATNNNDIEMNRSLWWEYKGVFEEQYLRRLIYNIASLTKYTITIINPKKYENMYNETTIVETTPDIKMCSNSCCIMIQVKYNSTAQDVLNQLILHSRRDETTKHVLIGVNLDENQRLSMIVKIDDDLFAFA